MPPEHPTKDPENIFNRLGDWARRHRRGLAWTGGVIAVVMVAFVLFLAFFDWNYLRGPISRFASMKTGREVAILGDLDVNALSLKPSATVRKIRIGNPSWAGKGPMAEVEKLEVQIKVLPLLRGQLVLLRLEVDKPVVALVRDRQGRSNWDFSNGRKKNKEPFKMPPVRRFVIDDGRLKYSDAKRRLTLDATINATERLGAANRGFAMAGRGSINGEPFILDLAGGPLLNVDPDKAYPFNADVRAGATRITAKGTIPKPFDLGRFQADFVARGSDLADLYDLIGVPLPNTPPYRLAGKLSREVKLWKVGGIGGKVGDSDMAGDLSIDTAGERPFLRGDLHSKLLDFDDLGAIFGAAPSAAPGETVSVGQKVVAREMIAEQRLLPDATLKVDRIRAMDADVKYRAASIRAPHLPLRAASVRVKLNDGLLIADPLRFDLPQGNIAGQVRLDARKDVPVSSIDVRLSNARIEQLIPIKAGGGTPLTGSLVGRVKLSGAGNSVHQAAANANGEVLIVAPGGEIREAFAELMGINVTKGLGLLLAKDQSKADLRCAVAHFDAKNGVLTANQIVFDTEPVLGTGKGTINLGTEKIDFRIAGHAKEPRLIRVIAPITVKGAIKSPKIGVEAGTAVAQGGIAALLTTLTPLAVILPFLDLGLAKDAACGSLIANAGREGAPVRTPKAR
ncbi:AsmA family protein [Phenylobacterium sp.]|uniref:AsmA family protein n=1 Tax=Phenylobacterium sp. TaxID=1871053 RepID=UPI0027313F4D|nr:AsmA family protein [Phenylobacterium sp.]MDP1598756.1 AsmA family protein [Phenylobacterium sp.]MDP3592335.1 AsmA family protein [Phenylobacterium sp.]